MGGYRGDTMKFNLIDNAVDSLKSTYISLNQISELYDGYEHHAKDAILALNHANELLFKVLLRTNKEYLIFTDINKYMDTKEKMLAKGKESIFEVTPNLQTVSFSEAIRRLELLCDFKVSDSLKKSLMYLNKIRNEIMHYEVNLNSGEFHNLIEKMQNCYELTIEFFSAHINELEERIDEARFEITEDDYYDYLQDIDDMGKETYMEWLEGTHED